MRPDIHPDYRPVVFQDANTGAQFLTRSTITSSRTIDWETPTGVQTYPLVVVEVSSDSHPFWTVPSEPSTPRAGWRSSTSATAVARHNSQRRPTSVADEALVAHQEIGQESVVRDLRRGVMCRMTAAVDVGDGRLGQQVIDQIAVVGDRADHQRMP